MKVLRVDFVERRPVGVWPWVALILVAGGLTAYQGWLGWGQHARLRELRVQQSSLSEKIEAAGRVHRQAVEKIDVPVPYWTDAAAVARIASFPLNRALASLEAAQVMGVKVIGIEVLANENIARVDVEFADHISLLAYLEAINAGESMPRWVLVQAQVSLAAAAGNVASLSSNWATPER